MTRVPALLMLCTLSGCMVGANFLKKDKDAGVRIPVLIGAGIADFVLTSLASGQIDSFSVGAAIATGLAVTAVDLGAACVLGACQGLPL